MIENILKAASWLVAIGLVIVTIVPANERPVTGIQHDLEHFSAFGLAGLLFGLAYFRHLRALFFGAVIFALVLELSQIPLSTRHARLADFVVDAVAACLGIIVAHVCREFMKNRGPEMGIDPLVSDHPASENLRLLEEAVIKFNVHATGLADGKPFGSFLRDAENVVVGGISGWTWGKTCFIGYLFVPAELRKQGYGMKLVDAVEAEAIDRGCSQIILRTYDFQAPHFYIKLGFKAIARIPDCPVGHDEFTMIKRLAKPSAPFG
jgi:GNAT superfamily N-acetyltransferase